MSQRLILFAKTILTMDRPKPIEDGFVIIQGHRILQVGKRKDLFFLPSSRMLELGDTILMPGLINAHCHLDYTTFKGKVPFRGGFREWLTQMAVRSRNTPTAEFRRSIEKGIQESLGYGTTTLCDVATTWESPALLERSGLRSFVFLEMIDLDQSSPKLYWKHFQDRLRSVLPHESPIFRWGLSPHTPFTVSKELFQLSGRYLDSHRDVLTMVHMAESREEAAYFKTGRGPMADRISALNPAWTLPRATTPVQYLNGCGWLPKLDLGVHLNLVDGKDLSLLAKNRITVVHCPGSHEFFGHPDFPYGRMKKHRIPVCLGTDSLASNQSLSLFREMRLFQKKHPEVSSHEVLSMATVKPAQALGLGKQFGQIRPGFLADMVGIPMPKKVRAPRSFYEQAVGYKGTVTFAMIHGELKLRLTV